MTDRLSDERIEQIRARIRRDTICPSGYAPVKGGAHHWVTYDHAHIQCAQCGHITIGGRVSYLVEVHDLYGEAVRLRELDDMAQDWEQRLADLRHEHQRQAAAWDKQREQLTADRDRIRRELDARTSTPCGPGVPCEDGGEPCDRHEREQAHADGEHELCGPECEPLRLAWSPQDIELGDDGGAVLMLTHTGGQPAVLELEPEAAAALRDDLTESFDGPCWHLHCAVCQADDRHGSGICFPDSAAATAYGRRHGWRLDDDRQVCPSCADDDGDEHQLGITDRDETAVA
jgi:hypothetical protein